MQKGEVTKDELETIKNYRNGTFAIGLENAQTKASFAINIDQYNLPKDYYTNYLKNVAAVSLEDVNAISKKYMNLRNGYILVVGNQEEVAEKIKRFSPTGSIQYYDSYGNEVAETTMKPAPEGVTSESVLNKYIEAVGGEKAINKLKSARTVYNASFQGMNFNITTINVMPNKYLNVTKVGEQVFERTVYNGQSGQVTGIQGKKSMSEEELNNMKTESLLFPELAFKGGGYELQLKGVDAKYGEEAYVLEIKMPDDKVQTNYYSTGSGLKLAIEQMEETDQGNFLASQVFKDYKPVKKILFPHIVNQSQGPMNFDLKVEVIEINKKFDEDLFKVEE